MPVSLIENGGAVEIREAAEVVEISSQPFGISIGSVLVDGTRYTGATTVTPSRSTQILETSGKTIDGNITVNPIPSNYGLITWDGSVITVS